MTAPGMGRAAASIGLLIGLFGLGVDVVAILPDALAGSEDMPARGLPDALVWFWTYFTHLSNLGLVLVYVAVLMGWGWLGWFRSVRTQAAMGGYILLVMLYYHFMLSGLYVMTGWLQVGSVVLHYVAPICYLAWWALFVPHGSLKLAHIPMMLVPGLAYVAWALLRGLVVGEYPYDILDAGRFGYGQVAIGVGMLLVAVVVFCAVLVGADRLLGRRTATQEA